MNTDPFLAASYFYAINHSSSTKGCFCTFRIPMTSQKNENNWDLKAKATVI